MLSRPARKTRSRVPNVRGMYRNVEGKDKEMGKLCLRIGNLEVIRAEVEKLQKKFLKEAGENAVGSLVEKTLVKVYDFIAFKLAFSDLASAFEGLYVGDNTLATGLQTLAEPFRTLCARTPENHLSPVLQRAFKALVSAWMYYLLCFIPVHKAEELAALPALIANDQEFFNDFFASNDIESAGKGLTEEFMREEAAVIDVIARRLRQSDQELIAAYKNAENDKGYMKEIIVRVLFGRSSSEANQFFKLHANIILR